MRTGVPIFQAEFPSLLSSSLKSSLQLQHAAINEKEHITGTVNTKKILKRIIA